MNRMPSVTGLAFKSPAAKSQSSKSSSFADSPFSLARHLESYDIGVDEMGFPESGLVPHCLFSPIHYESGYAYPLIVWLHGPGDNQDQLQTVLPLVSMRNHVAVAPQGTYAEGLQGAFRWRQTREDVDEAVQRTLDCIDIATSRYNIHPERIFLAGYDCGGTMALRIAIENPDLFAGAVSIGGPLPRGPESVAARQRVRGIYRC